MTGLPPAIAHMPSDDVVTEGLRKSDRRSTRDFLWLPDAQLPGEPSHHLTIRPTIAVARHCTTRSGCAVKA